MIPVQPRVTLDQEMNPPRRVQNPDDPSGWHLDLLLGRRNTQQSAIQFYYGERPPLANPVQKQKGKRVAEQSIGPGVQAKKRKPRSCPACQNPDCPGAYLSRPCMYQKVCLFLVHHPVQALNGIFNKEASTYSSCTNCGNFKGPKRI
jgi:hypothetical protein